MKRTLLCFALMAVAGVCCAQSPAPAEFGTIPSWVKLDKTAFADDRAGDTEERMQLATLTHELNSRTRIDSPDRYPGHGSRFGPVEAYRYDERPVNSQVPKATDAPPPGLARPSVEAAGWKVSMPSIRAHAARLLLQRSF
jgi:hypothetical protein